MYRFDERRSRVHDKLTIPEIREKYLVCGDNYEIRIYMKERR